MDLRHPVQSLSWAMSRALEADLAGVESAEATALLSKESGPPVRVRPDAGECSVVLFTQTWTEAELGFDRRVSEAFVDAETVVITGPCGDACVYVSTQLLYHVASPNRRFFLDLAAQHLKGRHDRLLYEGRDSVDEEAFDYEVAGALARVCGALRRCGPADAERVARQLRACLDEVELAGHTPRRWRWAPKGTETGAIQTASTGGR